MPTFSDAFLDDPPTSPGARLTLFCYPHAGGGAHIFSPWTRALAPDVEVRPFHPPGRGVRDREPLCSDLERLVAGVADVLERKLDRPYALFGHSFGAIVCFEVLRTLRRRGAPPPSALFVSGRRAPHMPLTHGPLDALGDVDLLRELGQHYGGVSPELLESEDLRGSFVPAIRTDMMAYVAYAHRPEAPFEFPIFAYCAEEDRTATAAEAKGWAQQTTKSFRLTTLPGDHFFLLNDRPMFLGALKADLSLLLGNGALQARRP